jgi:serine/threonine protein kinase/tetratricopeptide (TPR) repeat protein
MSDHPQDAVPPVDSQATRPQPPTERHSRTIGPYRLLHLVGEGGMGEVWLAEQTHPVRRQVALKVIKAGMDTAQVVARFEAERQALALMDHPAIATVYDGGSTPEGRPYFAMEYVRGEPITTYCDRQRLTTQERLELFMQVCEGVQHAHQKGIIHRDLKPSNVLVTIQDDHPVPKIIDFGVAKATAQHLTERTLYTELGVMIGTPEYMSPEQAEMGGLDIDTRTDVYALGVILYELLTGALPFDRKALRQAGFAEIQRTIREKEPPRPSTRITQLGPASTEAAANRHTEPRRLASELRGDLDWVTMRALEKDRTRRYQTANALAGDLRHHLNNEPVFAGPRSTVYRAKKFVRRHRFGVAAAAALVLLLLVFGVTMAVQAQRIAAERDRANREAARANQEAESARQVSDFLVGLFKVSDPGEARGNSVTAREVLDAGAAKIDRDLKDQPLVQAQLMSSMGRVYGSLGLYNEALTLQENALAIRRRLLGEQHLDVASSLLGVATILWYRGDYGRAKSLYEQGLELRERLLGKDAPAVADGLHNLGNLLWSRGEYDEAQRRLERALAIREKLAPESADVAATFNSLGAIAYKQGDYSGAGRLWERTLAIREKTLGPDHPLIAQALNNLAVVHTFTNDPAGARPLLERAVRIQEKVLGPKHADLASGLMNLGDVVRAAGDDSAARSHYARAVAIFEEASPGNPELGRFLDRLAWATLQQGDTAAARGLFERSLALRERALGAEHHDVAESSAGLAECARRQGRPVEAAQLFERSMVLCRRPDGGYFPQAIDTLDRYVVLLRETGQKARADEMEALAASIRK